MSESKEWTHISTQRARSIERVRSFMRDHGEVEGPINGPRGLHKAIGLGHTACQDAFNQLVKWGEIERIPDGRTHRYRWVGVGQQVMRGL